MSNLEKHAEEEMRRAGLYDKDADYGGVIPEAVMKLVKTHAAEGHSGASHSLVLGIFIDVVNFRPLTPLTADPAEWIKVDPDHYQPGTWQNRRLGSAFSRDGGQTHYDIDTPGSWHTCNNCKTHFPIGLVGIQRNETEWYCSDSCLERGKDLIGSER
jgi:hypothetical protein